MEATQIKTVDCTLSMEEAIYLKDLVQKHIGIGEESEQHKKVRESIWEGLARVF